MSAGAMEVESTNCRVCRFCGATSGRCISPSTVATNKHPYHTHAPSVALQGIAQRKGGLQRTRRRGLLVGHGCSMGPQAASRQQACPKDRCVCLFIACPRPFPPPAEQYVTRSAADTILMASGKPLRWYFSARDGRLMRHRRMHCTWPHIYSGLLKQVCTPCASILQFEPGI